MLLAWDNKGDVAVVTAGSQIATLPGSNVQNSHVSRKWNTVAGVKSSNLTFDMGSQVSCSMLALLGVNLSQNAIFRLRTSPTDPAVATDVDFDSGIVRAAPAKALKIPHGTSGTYADTPNSPATTVNGDIDVRAKIALDTYTVGGHEMYILNKGENTRSWLFTVGSGGTLIFYLYADGINLVAVSPSSSVSLNTVVADGEPVWIRCTRVAATGVTNFYYSRDGVTWTLLGAANVASTAGNLFDAGQPLNVCQVGSGLGVDNGGYVYFAEIRDGINGKVVAKFDPNTDAAEGASSFTSSETREVWTVFAGDQNGGIAAVDSGALKTGFGALYRQLRRAYVNLPGLGANYVSTPDSARNSVLGDIDIRVRVSLRNFGNTGLARTLVSKYDTAGQRSFLFQVGPGGSLFFYSSPDGLGTSLRQSTVTLGSVGINDGMTVWLRVTEDVDNGAGNNATTFYYSYDGTTWTQLGAALVNAGVDSIFNGTATLQIGAFNAGGGGDPAQGRFYYAEVRDGIKGRVCAVFDPSRAAATGATSFTGRINGEVWTVNQAGSPKAELIMDVPPARYWRLDLTDNSAPSNLQVGRVFLGPSWSSAATLLYGWGITPMDPSNVKKSRGGQSYADTLPQFRRLEFTLDFQSETDIFTNAFAMARANGVVKDVLAIPFESGDYVAPQAVWGLCKVSQPVIHMNTRRFSQKVTVEERL